MTNVSYAREQIAMRNRIQTGLTPAEQRQINWPALHTVTVNAIARGWTGEELAHWALGDIGPNTENIGATIHTTLKTLSDIDPPRPAETPTPPNIIDLRAQLNTRREPPAANPTAWAQRIRTGLTYIDATPTDTDE